MGRLTPFDSLGGGVLGAVVILALNWVVVELTYRSKRLRRVLAATPTLLICPSRSASSRLASVSMSFFSAL